MVSHGGELELLDVVLGVAANRNGKKGEDAYFGFLQPGRNSLASFVFFFFLMENHGDRGCWDGACAPPPPGGKIHFTAYIYYVKA